MEEDAEIVPQVGEQEDEEGFDISVSLNQDEIGSEANTIELGVNKNDIQLHTTGSMDINIRPKRSPRGRITMEQDNIDLNLSSSKEIDDFLMAKDVGTPVRKGSEVEETSYSSLSGHKQAEVTKLSDTSDSLAKRLERLEGMLAESPSASINVGDSHSQISKGETFPSGDSNSNSGKVSATSSSLEERMERLDRMLTMSINDVSLLEEQSKVHFMETSAMDQVDEIVSREDPNDVDLDQGVSDEDDSLSLSVAKDFPNDDDDASESDNDNMVRLEDDSLLTKESQSRISTGYLQSWDQVNRMLETAGFSSVPSGEDGLPDPTLLQIQIRELVSKYEKRGKIIQEMAISKESNRKKQSSSQDRLESSRAKVDEIRIELEKSKNRCKLLEEKLTSSGSNESKELKKFEAENLGLKQKLKQSEHRVKSKEVALERLQEKLADELKRQHAQKERDRRMFREIERRVPRRTSITDQKILDVVGVFENQREELQKEVDHLKGEIRKLTQSLRDKDNWLQRHVLDQTSVSDPSIERYRDELDSKRREQMATSAALKEKEKLLVNKMANVEKNLQKSIRERKECEETIDNLKLELASRPTMRDWRASQHKISKLERQLHCAIETLEEEEAKNNSIYFHHENHDSNRRVLSQLRENKKQKQSIRESIEARAQAKENEEYDRNHMEDTRSQIRKDRLNHTLGLNRLSSLPKNTSHEILQSICRLLYVSDPEIIIPAIQKMTWIVQAMPRLEKFVKEVLSFVTINGDKNSDFNVDVSSADMIQSVLPQLKRWSSDSRFVTSFRKFRNQIVVELGKSNASDFPAVDGDDVTDDSILQHIRNLVRLEVSVLGQNKAFASADEQIRAHPELLVNQIMLHFQQLFNVKNMEGVLPKINEVYVFSNEMKNFLQVLRPMLGLAPNASTHACLNVIEDSLRRDTPPSHHNLLHEPKWPTT